MPFGAELTRRLGVPASIDSDANLVALAEHWFGQARDLNDFLVVSVERSLGRVILHYGELFRGANGLSPDLGDLMVRAPGNGGGRLGDMASEISVIGENDAALPSGRGMDLLLRRADDGDKACLAALAPQESAWLRRRQSHHPVRAAQSYHNGPCDGEQRAFHPAFA